MAYEGPQKYQYKEQSHQLKTSFSNGPQNERSTGRVVRRDCSQTVFFTETRFTYFSMEGRAWLNLAGLQSNKDFYS